MKTQCSLWFRFILLMGLCVAFTGCVTQTLYSSTTKEDTHKVIEILGSAELFTLSEGEVLQASIHPQTPIPIKYREFGNPDDPLYLESSVSVPALLEPLDEGADWASARFHLSSKGIWTFFGPSVLQLREISALDPNAVSLVEIPLFRAHYETRSWSKTTGHYAGLVALTPITMVIDLCTLPIQAWWEEHVDEEDD